MNQSKQQNSTQSVLGVHRFREYVSSCKYVATRYRLSIVRMDLFVKHNKPDRILTCVYARIPEQQSRNMKLAKRIETQKLLQKFGNGE